MFEEKDQTEYVNSEEIQLSTHPILTTLPILTTQQSHTNSIASLPSLVSPTTSFPPLSPLPTTPEKLHDQTDVEKQTTIEYYFTNNDENGFLEPPQQMLQMIDEQEPTYLNKLITPAEKEYSYTIPKKRSHGKDISLLKRQYDEEKNIEEEEDDDYEDERKEEELRTTTKNNKRFYKELILKKRDVIIKKFPILSKKNEDLIVTAENKYNELKSIFVLKKKYIEKNKQFKEHIFGLELVEHRYRCESNRLEKKKRKFK